MATAVTLATESNTSSPDPTNITVLTDRTVPTASDPLQSDNTAAIIGGVTVVAVILIMAILIGIIAIVALVLRARRGSMSIKTPVE